MTIMNISDMVFQSEIEVLNTDVFQIHVNEFALDITFLLPDEKNILHYWVFDQGDTIDSRLNLNSTPRTQVFKAALFKKKIDEFMKDKIKEHLLSTPKYRLRFLTGNLKIDF